MRLKKRRLLRRLRRHVPQCASLRLILCCIFHRLLPLTSNPMSNMLPPSSQRMQLLRRSWSCKVDEAPAAAAEIAATAAEAAQAWHEVSPKRDLSSEAPIWGIINSATARVALCIAILLFIASTFVSFGTLSFDTLSFQGQCLS